MVLVTLPGGSRPEIDSERCETRYDDWRLPDGEGWSSYSGCALAGSDEGATVLLADISFSRSEVFWNLTFGADAGTRWEFRRAQYEAAIRRFLEMLGEQPVLISDEEWAAPPVTRVVPA
jgi:hypothetical protein